MLLLAQDAAAGQWNSLSSGSLFTGLSAEHDHNRYVGAGLQYEFDPTLGRWVGFVAASQIIDANQDDAYFAGAGSVKRIWMGNGNHPIHLDIGFVACAMQRNDYQNGDTVLSAFPTFSLGLRKVALNMSYISNPQQNFGKVLILQLKLRQIQLW